MIRIRHLILLALCILTSGCLSKEAIRKIGEESADKYVAEEKIKDEMSRLTGRIISNEYYVSWVKYKVGTYRDEEITKSVSVPNIWGGQRKSNTTTRIRGQLIDKYDHGVVVFRWPLAKGRSHGAINFIPPVRAETQADSAIELNVDKMQVTHNDRPIDARRSDYEYKIDQGSIQYIYQKKGVVSSEVPGRIVREFLKHKFIGESGVHVVETRKILEKTGKSDIGMKPVIKESPMYEGWASWPTGSYIISTYTPHGHNVETLLCVKLHRKTEHIIILETCHAYNAKYDSKYLPFGTTYVHERSNRKATNVKGPQGKPITIDGKEYSTMSFRADFIGMSGDRNGDIPGGFARLQHRYNFATGMPLWNQEVRTFGQVDASISAEQILRRYRSRMQ